MLESAAVAPNATSTQPNYWQKLTEPASIAMAAKIHYQPIQTPLQAEPISTAVVTAEDPPTSEPFLLIHGFDSSLLEYRHLFPRLAETAPVWAIDLLGFGFTERPAGLKFSAAAIKTHLYHSWKTLIDQPMIWVGASMGGAAVLDFALTYPEAVKKLILIDSAGVQPGPPGHLLVPPLGWLASEFLRSPQVRRQICRNAFHNPNCATTDAQACAASHLQVTGWRQALIQFTKSGGYPSLEQQLAQLQIPTLILWGESDRILGTQDASKLQRAIPNSQLAWITEAGHVPHVERPEEVTRQITAWLTGLPISSPI